jgi:hypothetical protein
MQRCGRHSQHSILQVVQDGNKKKKKKTRQLTNKLCLIPKISILQRFVERLACPLECNEAMNWKKSHQVCPNAFVFWQLDKKWFRCEGNKRWRNKNLGLSDKIRM